MQEQNKEFEKFISGFVAGEGFFYTQVKRERVYSASFAIKLSRQDEKVLIKIKEYFKCGKINYSKYDGRDQILFRVSKISDLVKIVIPFFERNSMYPANKQETFNKWKVIVFMIYNKEHLKKENFVLMTELARSLNRDGKSNGNQYTKKLKGVQG